MRQDPVSQHYLSALSVADVDCSGWAMLFVKDLFQRPTKHWSWQLIPGTSSAHMADPILDRLTILLKHANIDISDCFELALDKKKILMLVEKCAALA